MRIFALVLMLLFGCVSQGQYDSLSEKCENEKNDLRASLDTERGKADDLTGKLSECADERDAAESELSSQQEQMQKFVQDSTALGQAREKAKQIQDYELALEYYLNAFGPGKVPNTAKMNLISSQVGSLNDTVLAANWNNLQNCQGITGCDSTKGAFVQRIEDRKQELASEIVELVKADA